MHFDVVIVGGGHGGATAAIALRQQGYEGTIALVSREPDPPYERPPLTKEYLLGEKPRERLLIRPLTFWSEKGIQVFLEREVLEVEPTHRLVTLRDGEKIGYTDLIWAAGGDPRKLDCPGVNLPGVFSIRTRADVDDIVAELSQVTRVVVVGGGFIGLEAAAALRRLGKDVVLLEVLPRVLARVAGPELSAFFEAEHRSRGVDLRTGVGVVTIEGSERVTGVRLTDDSLVDAQLVIVGIGIAPCVEPLLEANAVGGNGVEVDEYCRTSLPHIYAIGDCAAHANAFARGTVVRLESVQNATDQAICVARAICGKAQPYEAVPWFWSFQYDVKLQTLGISALHDARVVRGDPASRSFSVAYLRDGALIALDCVNAIKDFVQGRKLVETRAVIEPSRLADTTRDLKELFLPAR